MRELQKRKKLFLVACRLTLIGTFISFVGWCFEKLGRFIIYGAVGDRGFLFLPLCPIYGISVVFSILLLGTPLLPDGLLLSKVLRTWGSKSLFSKRRWITFAIYFSFTSVAATAIELITGLLLFPFGIRLWDYSERFLNLWGIVCPMFSLLWGALITLFATFAWIPLYRLFSKIPAKSTFVISITLATTITVDFIANIVLLILKFLSS